MEMKCSFCGLPYEQEKVISGITGNICEECVNIVYFKKDFFKIQSNDKFKKLKPKNIKLDLDKYIVGQDNSKKKLAVEICNHYKRMNFQNEDIEIPKSNILLIGPTGSGKTYLLEVLSKILDVPLVIGDATSLTESGYVGKDVDSLLASLIDKANGDIKKAESGIIYIDEIDKIKSDNSNRNNGKDVGGEGVQQALLKIIDGMEYTFEKTGETINTKNILFVCGGAFVGLEKIIEKRTKKKMSIGFNVNLTEKPNDNENLKENILSNVQTEDLIEFGLIREFLGRMHLITVLNELTIEDLKNILTKPKNSIVKQYQTLMKLDNINLEFSDDAIGYIAEEAKKKGTGARALKGILSNKLSDLLYELESEETSDENKKMKDFTITKKYLENV